VLPDHHAESSHAIPPYAQPPTDTSSIIPTSTAISPTLPHETMSVFAELGQAKMSKQKV